MPYPITPNITIDFSNGATFGYPFVIGSGVFGQNVLADAVSLVVNVSSQVVKVNIKRGYNLLQDQFQVGTGSFRILDPNGDFNPQNTASPYYGKLLPLRKIRLSATYNGNVYFLFSGYVTAWNYTYPQNQDIGYVDVEAQDAFRLFQMANVTTITGQAAGQDSGTRITKILDTVSFPNSMRSIDSGITTMQADPATGRTALSALKMAEFTEQGAFFMDGSGIATFINRTNLQKKFGQTATYFSNTGDGGISYKGVTFANDDKLVINQASITSTGLATQTFNDATSIATYFPHSFTITGVLTQTTDEASNIAKAYVVTRKDTTIRIDSMTLDLTTPNYSTGITAALGAKYFDVVKIKNEGQGTTSITKTLEIVGIEHEITPQSWRTTLTTSEPIIDAFLMGNATFGIIGTSVMTY